MRQTLPNFWRAVQKMPMPMLVLVPSPPEFTPVDITEYLYLAEVISRRFYKGNERIRDTEVFSIACQELVKVGKKYNSAVGPFDRLAMRAMRNGIIQYIRRQQMKKRDANFQLLSDQEWQDFSKRGWRDVPQEMIEESNLMQCEALAIDVLPKLLSSLCHCDRKLIEDIYINNISMAKISSQLNISRMTIYNRSQRILKTLREKLNNVNQG